MIAYKKLQYAHDLATKGNPNALIRAKLYSNDPKIVSYTLLIDDQFIVEYFNIDLLIDYLRSQPKFGSDSHA